MDKLDHVADREAVRLQDAFGTAVIAGREQFKRTDAVGLDVTSVVPGRHSQVFTGLSPFNRYRDTPFQYMEPNLAMALATRVSCRAFSLTMIRAAPTYQRPHETVGRDQATPFSAWDHLSC